MLYSNHIHNHACNGHGHRAGSLNSHQQEFVACLYLNGRSQVECTQRLAQVYRVSVHSHHSSKMMRMLWYLAMAICLLPKPAQTVNPFYPYWPFTGDCSKGATQSCEGWYWVRDSTTDKAKKTYLYPNSHPICGEGVWMRIGYFDMTKAFSECPSPLQMFLQNNKKYCRRQSSGCTSVYFDSLSQQYTEVCGMVEGYQYGSMDAFHLSTASKTPDDLYVDGISITHGCSPRRHLWTYAVGLNANPDPGYNHAQQCPCTAAGTSRTLPTFLGNDYYCNSGNPSGNSFIFANLYPDRLWDNSGPSCVSGSTCCDNPDQPWFKKKLTQPANEDVEMRWCGSASPVFDESTATTRVELHVRVD